MRQRLKILTPAYLQRYKKVQPLTISKHVKGLAIKNSAMHTPEYYISISIVYSSMIEGVPIDMDTYARYRSAKIGGRTKPMQQIEDLRKAYDLAQHKPLTLTHFLKAHALLSAHFPIEKKYQGKWRDRQVNIITEGKIIYTGANQDALPHIMQQLFDDIALLQSRKLTLDEVFYYAAQLHLRMAHIHPFADGNGRAARLIEKWFLSTKIGAMAWRIPSEQLYHQRLKSYYKRINLGKDYSSLNYDHCIPFLLLLPMSLRIK